MTDPTPQGDKRAVLRDIAEDATGFGGAELKTTRDLILRPGEMLDAYDALGPTGGGAYARPFRYYLTINGLYLVVIAVLGGFAGAFSIAPPEMVSAWAALAGKSVDAFIADADQWYGLSIIPITAFFMFWPLYWLFRAWSRANPSVAARQVWVFMSLWTLYALPFGLLNILAPDLMRWTTLVGPIIWAVAMIRVGRGRWWRTTPGLVGKTLVLATCLMLAFLPTALTAFAVAAVGAIYGP